jgi:phospholipid/cholesterol/gamma-HCH transport system substrate-binding protein
VKRANPALRETDRVLAQLARQNHELARLAANSDRVLAPLARERAKVAGFIRNATTASEATAERNADLEASFQKFPAALQALRRQMVQLQRFSDQARPTFADFAQAAPNITRSTKALGPFAHAATPALTTLGETAQKSTRPIVKSDPTLVKARNLVEKAPPAANSLTKLLSTLRKTGGYKQLMHLIYFTTGAVNGFDKFGHFLRATLQVTGCTTLSSIVTPGEGCLANWGNQVTSATTPAGAKSAILQQAKALGKNTPEPSNGGVPFDAQGDLAGSAASGPTDRSNPDAPPLGAARDLLDTIIGRQGPVPDGGGPSTQYATPNTQGGTAP